MTVKLRFLNEIGILVVAGAIRREFDVNVWLVTVQSHFLVQISNLSRLTYSNRYFLKNIAFRCVQENARVFTNVLMIFGFEVNRTTLTIVIVRQGVSITIFSIGNHFSRVM